MPPVERTGLNQVAILWPLAGYDRYGQPAVDVPKEIPVNWTERKSEVLGPQGNKIAIDATAIVDEVISIGSHIWLGTLKDWYSFGSAGQPNDLREVKMVNVTNDLENKNQLITIGVMRLHDSTEP